MIVDLRSDVVSTPTEEMLEAMQKAHLGLASAGEDTSINILEELAAQKMGKEAALFVPTGTFGNLLASFTHTRRGEQIILEEYSHHLWSEEWGISTICGLLPRLLKGISGTALDPDDVERAITETRFLHLPPTGLVWLENTMCGAGGTIMTPQQTAAVCKVAHKYSIPVHLDGARIFNAAVALGIDVKDLVGPVDTVLFCLSKGLSAPIGSVLCGPRTFIEKAWRNRRVLGVGGIHKWGIAAAAGVVALNTMIDRLAEDHTRAKMLAEGISSVPGLEVDLLAVQTNIIMVDVSHSGLTGEEFLIQLEKHGVKATLRGGNVIRLVTHRLIKNEDVVTVIEAIGKVAGLGARQAVPK